MKDKNLRAKNIRTGLAMLLVIVASVTMTVIWALQYAAL